jgi:hypothetical protein
METQVAYTGTCRQTAFGINVPEFVPVAAARVSMDVMNLPHNCVPLKYEAGRDFCMILPEESIDTLCFVFKLAGDYQIINVDAIKDYMATVQIDPERFHIAERTMINRETKMVRTIYVRIYRNEDFTCKEHPEMLLGQPLGQYHCPYCGDMQVAGMMHLPPEEQWMPVAGTERGMIEASPFKADPKFAELCADAQALDDADGRKMGDPESE